METTPTVEKILDPTEEAMYGKFVSKNPGITKQDFKELRTLALGAKTTGVKSFFEINNIVMSEQPDSDSQKEIKGN